MSTLSSINNQLSLGVSNKMGYTHIKPLIRITVLGFQEMVMYDEERS